MHGNIVELAYQLRRQVGVIWHVSVNLLVSGGCYLQVDSIFIVFGTYKRHAQKEKKEIWLSKEKKPARYDPEESRPHGSPRWVDIPVGQRRRAIALSSSTCFPLKTIHHSLVIV